MNDELIKYTEEMFDNKVYLVGGAVRDHLLGKPVKDYDFSTPFTPDEIEAKIKAFGRRALRMGKRFGTLAFKYKGEMVEVTSFRIEKYKPGCRKPYVEYIKDITADLSRRDFTINAMAMRNGKIIDPFGGREDLKAGVLKAVGNPTQRFKEDPLRILRGCRFASQLGFNIEEQTFKKMKEYAQQVLNVSKERWVAELDKLLLGTDVGKGLSLLWEIELFKYMIPELQLQYEYDQNNPNHGFNLHIHTIYMVDKLPKDINLRWAGLLHDVAKPMCRRDRVDKSTYYQHELVGSEIVLHIAQYLKWSNDRRDIVYSLVKEHLNEDSPLKEADMAAKGI